MRARDLVALGFAEAGICTLDRGLKSRVRFTLHRHQKDRVIYAFVVDDDVKYIGACDNTKTCLLDRMQRYQGIMGAGTNKRIVRRIKRALKRHASVRIYAWRPAKRMQVGVLEVDLVMGLEKPLIRLANPTWNKQR